MTQETSIPAATTGRGEALREKMKTEGKRQK